MKKTILSLGFLLAVSLSAFAQNETGQKNVVNETEQKKPKNGVEQNKMENAMKAVEKEQQVALSHAGTFAKRFETFVKSASANRELSDAQKEKLDSTYHAYLDEYSIVKDSISDEDVRRVSKAKVTYQKLQVRNFTDKTTDQVSDVANTIGEKVSKVFKRTKKKVQGAIEGFKKE